MNERDSRRRLAKPRANGCVAVVALMAAIFVGCDGGSDPAPSGAKPPAAAVSSQSQWEVTGDLQPAAAIADGNPATLALSRQQYRGAQVTIDLGKPSVFNTVVVDHGRQQFGFCRRMAVLTSLDGKNFEHRASVPGTRRVTTACLLTPVLARYVRLQAEVPGDDPWSIADVRIR